MIFYRYTLTLMRFDSNLTLPNVVKELSRSRNDDNHLEIWAKLYYDLTNNLPTLNNLMDLDFIYLHEGLDGLINYCRNTLIKLRLKNVEMKEFAPNSIFIDISHTFSYPFLTGIQRVVRSLSVALSSYENVHFIRFDPSINNWVLIGKEFNFNKSQKITFKSNRFNILLTLSEINKAFWYGIYSMYKYLNSSEKSFINNFNLEKYKLIISRIRQWRIQLKLKAKKQIIPDFTNQNLFIVENLQNSEIIDRLEFFEKIGKLQILVYDLIPISHPQFFPINSRNSFTQYLRLISFSSKVVAISEFTKTQVLKYSSLKKNCDLRTIKLPTWNPYFESKPYYSPKSSEKIKVGIPKILCVGTIEPRKNHLNLLRAAELLWAKNVSFELILVGGRGWLNKNVFEYLKILNNKKYAIKHYVNLSDLELEKLYNDCKLVISVPWVEGFGLPVSEGLSRNKIVIASDIPSHREIASDKYIVFVNPDNVERLAFLIEDNLASSSNLKLHAIESMENWNNFSLEVYNFIIGGDI